jgi:DNA-binding NarL/FixJ family response regulator
MTKVVIVADAGSEMARLTAAVVQVAEAELVRHASGRVPVGRLVAVHQPALVLIAEMTPRRLTVERLSEVRAAAPDAAVVVVAADVGSRSLASALRAGATAVLPGGLSASAMASVLQEVLAPDRGVASPLALAA